MKKRTLFLGALGGFMISAMVGLQATSKSKDNYMIRAANGHIQPQKDGTSKVKLSNVGKFVTVFPKTRTGQAPDAPKSITPGQFTDLWSADFQKDPPNAVFFYTDGEGRQNAMVAITEARATSQGQTDNVEFTIRPLTPITALDGQEVTDPVLIVDEGGGGDY